VNTLLNGGWHYQVFDEIVSVVHMPVVKSDINLIQ